MVKVIRKNGVREEWKNSKIVHALKLANQRAKMQFHDEEEVYAHICELVKKQVEERKEITVLEIHEVVQDVLKYACPDLYREYSNYRNFKKRYQIAYENAKEKSIQIIWNGDKENANKDSFLNSTKAFLIGNAFMGEMMKEFVMDEDWVNQHKEGYIHIHDLSERFINSKNCNLFNLAGVLDGGFELNGIRYEEPNTIRTAFSVAGDIVLSASSNQYGGFTISEIDKVLSKYAKKTYEFYLKRFLDDYVIDYKTAEKMAMNFTLEEIKKGYKGFEVKISTIGNALGQTPFITISFGLQTDYWSKKISEAILKQRIEGIGANKQTPIFPKLVFLHSKETIGEGKVNNDLFNLGIECSRTRLYPDFLSVDSDNSIGVSYKASGEPVTGMGCRAFLGYWEKDGKAIVNGRANIG